jgi:hypothetical protein
MPQSPQLPCSCPYSPATVSQLTQLGYATTYNNRGLLYLPHLHQRQLSRNNLWLGLVSPQTLSKLSTDLATFRFSDITSARTQEKTAFHAVAILHSHADNGSRPHGNHFRQSFYCCMNKCCYADVTFHVPSLHHSLLGHNLVMDISAG